MIGKSGRTASMFSVSKVVTLVRISAYKVVAIIPMFYSSWAIY